MHSPSANINIEVLEELFDENFNTTQASQKILGDLKIKKYNDVSELKKATLSTNMKIQKLPYELDVFIEKLTLSLYGTVGHIKQDLKSGNELTISEKHEKLLSVARDFNELSKTFFNDQHKNENENNEENKLIVSNLKQLNTVRENLETSIKTLKDFNKLINSSDLKQIISVSSMENELNFILTKDSNDKETKIAKVKQYKDILKQFESFYVAFVNVLLSVEGVSTEQQLEQLVIS